MERVWPDEDFAETELWVYIELWLEGLSDPDTFWDSLLPNWETICTDGNCV